jgi:CMP-N-acetylneuraminic acid synthetase
MKKSICVVSNARLQSTRVPQKMLRPFAGRSLVDIALERLNRLDFFTHRYLAVAEEELATLAVPYPNVEVLRRKPEAVAKGVNPQHVTFAHYREVPTDYIFVLNPCLPFLSVETIRKAFDYFQATDHPSYTSVIKTGDWVFDAGGNPVTNTDPRNLTTNKNVQFYKAAHAFHIVNKQFFTTHGIHWHFTRNDPHMIEIPEDECIDVDTPLEFEFAEFAYRSRAAEAR